METKDELDELYKRQVGNLTITLCASKDRMKLFLSAEFNSEGEAIRIDRPTLLACLPKNLSTQQLHADVLQDIVSNLAKGKSIPLRRVAKGLEPGISRDGKLILLVKPLAKKTGPPEFVDPWFIKNFDNIEIGTAVARRYKAHSGTPGKNVLGEELPATPGKEATVVTDQSLQVVQEADKPYDNIIAQQAGYLDAQGSTLKICEQLSLEGDVDLESGDIIFVGKVLIKGSVKKDFRVDARGDVTIAGDLLNGRVISTQGKVSIAGSALGDDSQEGESSGPSSLQRSIRLAENQQAHIICRGDCVLRTADSISVDAQGNILIEKEARLCNLHTKGMILMPQGHLVGGEIFTVCGVEASIIGTTASTPCLITLCSDIESSLEYTSLVAQINAHTQAVDVTKLYLGPYAEKRSRIQLLGPEHRKKMNDLLKKLHLLESALARLFKKKEELIRGAKHSACHQVNILKMAYPGLEIKAGTISFKLTEELKGPKSLVFNPDTKEFEVKDKTELQCVIQDVTPTA